jgi:transposase InsO family protein
MTLSVFLFMLVVFLLLLCLARRTWATSQQSPQLLAHLQWWRAYYHFVRPHASLRLALVHPRERGGRQLVQRYRQRGKATDDGQRGKCCVIPCRRYHSQPFESH